MATFPFPDNNITGIVSFFKYTNNLTEGLLGAVVLIIIGMTAFLSSKSYSTENSLAFSAFLVFISALLLRFMVIINDTIFFLVIVYVIGSLIYLYKVRSEGV